MTLVSQDTDYFDRRFRRMTQGSAQKELLFGGCRWAEGPVWFADANMLLWSDIPNNRMLKWTPGAGVTEYRKPSNYSNGHTRDREGRLVSCEHGARRVTRTEWDGSITVLADKYKGKRLNSPNDVVVKSDGTIWFTDPNYGIMSDYEGHKADMEQDGCYVYRVDPKTGAIDVVVDDFSKPNGLAFSPDESILYVADSGRSHDPDFPTHIRAFRVGEDGKVSDNGVFCVTDRGLPDGFRLDTDGNVWTSAGPAVEVFAPSGDMLGRLNFPQTVANVTFGGPKRNRLFVCCTFELYSVYVAATGALRP